PPSYQYHDLLRQFLLARAEELYNPSELQQYRLAPAAADLEEWPIRIFARKVQKRPLELLQALLALGGTDVAVSTLTEALWSDAEGDAAYHAFENTLYRLRQLLGAAGALVLSGGKLSLDS